MNEITDFLVRNMIAVYFFYGLAFFTMGLALAMTSRETSRLRFARAIPYMAAFGLLHGLHEWYEMGQRIAVETQQHVVGLPEEIVRLALLVVSFVMLLCFAVQLLVPASVPRERIWSLANLARGKYLRDLGNTPGHINHWTKRGFVELVARRCTVRGARSPFPWTMVAASVRD